MSYMATMFYKTYSNAISFEKHGREGMLTYTVTSLPPRTAFNKAGLTSPRFHTSRIAFLVVDMEVIADASQSTLPMSEFRRTLAML